MVLRMGGVEDWLEMGLGQELGKLQGRQLVKELGKLQGRQLVKELESVLVKGLGQELEQVLEQGLEPVLGMGLVEHIYETKYLHYYIFHSH
jgi:hypothetical protein